MELNHIINLLLVDEDNDYYILTREMIKEIETTQYNLEWAANYDEALQKIKQKRFHAYLFDYDLGQHTGIQLLAEATLWDRKTPVIILTNHDDYLNDTLAMNAGASDFLNKKYLKPDIMERSIRYSIQNRRLLYERDILIKEIDHRVKNSFQIISSILNLEIGQLKDEKARHILQDCRCRLNTLATLHEKMYQADNLTEIDTTGYFGIILKDIMYSLVSPERPIDCRFQVDDVKILPRQLMHCGLLFNELVSNAVKYAFPTSWQGTPMITVTLKEEQGLVFLCVADNGIGFPAHLDIHQTLTLGLKLVTILAEEQLRGQLTLDCKNGTTFCIRFKKE
jgi:two-component sensor histidine kinase